MTRPAALITGHETAHAIKAEEILRVSRELFADKGFRGTSTRDVAEAVGLKQATLFHYFKSKEDILRELLDRLVRTALTLSEGLKQTELSGAAKLWLLAYVDARELAADNYKGVRLMLLPTARGKGYATFWAGREQLRNCYRDLVRLTLSEAGAEIGDLELRSDVVFGITEAPVTWCAALPGPIPRVPTETANAVLSYLLPDHASVAAARERAEEMLQLTSEV